MPDKLEDEALPAETGCSLYRHLDATGRLLYVGVSVSTFRRLSEHRLYSRWFRSVDSMTIEWFETRAAAEAAERKAIAAERPSFNVQFGVSPSAALPLRLNEAMQPDELKAIRKVLGLSQGRMGEALGLTGQFVGFMENGRAGIEKRTALAVRYLAEHPEAVDK